MDLAKDPVRAVRGPAPELAELLREGNPDLLFAVLRDPRLEEHHLIEALRRRDLPAEILKAIARHPLFASRSVKIALAAHPKTPPQVFTSVLAQLHLFELITLLQHSGVLPDQKAAAERAVLRLLPDTPLGTKVTVAHRGSLRILEALLDDPAPTVIDAVLGNPQLKEATLRAFLGRASATPETISAIARHRRWGHLPSLRQALLHNGNTPAIWFTLFLPEVSTADVERLLRQRNLGERQRKEVEFELQKRRAGF